MDSVVAAKSSFLAPEILEVVAQPSFDLMESMT